ncbi:MAG: HAD hydrolase-like protein [Vicinamibacterales bacterium]
MRTTHIPSLAFDLDGTLTNPSEGITRSIAFALTELGITAPPLASLERYIGPPLRVAFPDLLQTDDVELVERAVALYRTRYRNIGLFENVVYPGVPEMLADLASTRPLFVATSKPVDFAERILRHFGLDRHFTRIFGSQLDGRHDDKGDLLEHVLSELALPPASLVMIGDREHDILAARRHGMPTIGVTYGFGSTAELVAAGADRLAESPDDVARLVATPV